MVNNTAGSMTPLQRLQPGLVCPMPQAVIDAWKGQRLTEAGEGRVLMAWCERAADAYGAAALQRLFHVPNGLYTGAGIAGARRKQRALQEGLKPGVPDYILPYARQLDQDCWSPGLAIELKEAKGGRVSVLQGDWLSYLSGQGWVAGVAHGAPAAAQLLAAYLMLPAASMNQLVLCLSAA